MAIREDDLFRHSNHEMSTNMSSSDTARYDAIKNSVQKLFGFTDENGKSQFLPKITFEDNTNIYGETDKNLPKCIHVNLKDYLKEYFDTDPQHMEGHYGLVTDLWITPSGLNDSRFDRIVLSGVDRSGYPRTCNMYDQTEFGGELSTEALNADFYNLGLVSNLADRIMETDRSMQNDGKRMIPDLRGIDPNILSNTEFYEPSDLVLTGQLKNSGLEYTDTSEEAKVLRGQANVYMAVRDTVLSKDRVNADTKDQVKPNPVRTVKNNEDVKSGEKRVGHSVKNVNANNVIKAGLNVMQDAKAREASVGVGLE